jgi:hypothetical protein
MPRRGRPKGHIPAIALDTSRYAIYTWSIAAARMSAHATQTVATLLEEN